MSSAETTKNGKPLKIHIIDPDTGSLFDCEGKFVIGLVGNLREDHIAFTTIYQGDINGVDALFTVKTLKELLIPALLDSLGMTEEQVSSFLENLKGEPDGNS